MPLSRAFSSFPEASRGRIVDCISIETTTSAYVTSIQDDVIHMLSWDDGLLEMIVPNDGYEIVMTRSERIAQVVPLVTRPFGGTDSCDEVRREDDEILR
ncbi:hypothetical protein CK203_083875 [Vitis vinifera]|uniref:Uncharacterized protein n=1 Tax=Vitis vinifera TaxID=29760 RepID=A0A438BUC2_VITVI|nr:hypothetical protein CK203_083875 [Vitis vinifera]